MTSSNQNVLFLFDEGHEVSNEQCGIDDWILENVEHVNVYDDNKVSHVYNYTENYTVKDLLFICDYYGFSKELKSTRRNKEQIVHFLVEFETDVLNNEVVCRRKNMWFYMNELKNDKFMKKYVLW